MIDIGIRLERGDFGDVRYNYRTCLKNTVNISDIQGNSLRQRAGYYKNAQFDEY